MYKTHNVNDEIITVEKYSNTRDNGLMSDFVYIIRQSRILTKRTIESADNIRKDYYTNKGNIREEEIFDTIEEAEAWLEKQGLKEKEIDGKPIKVYTKMGS